MNLLPCDSDLKLQYFSTQCGPEWNYIRSCSGVQVAPRNRQVHYLASVAECGFLYLFHGTCTSLYRPVPTGVQREPVALITCIWTTSSRRNHTDFYSHNDHSQGVIQASGLDLQTIPTSICDERNRAWSGRRGWKLQTQLNELCCKRHSARTARGSLQALSCLYTVWDKRLSSENWMVRIYSVSSIEGGCFYVPPCGPHPHLMNVWYSGAVLTRLGKPFANSLHWL